MATLVLQAAGGFVGGLVGGPVGALLGRAVGATLGAVVDQSLFGVGAKHSVGPRLTTLAGLTSSEGAAVPRVYGRARVGGQLIWATRFIETSNEQRAGGKGGGGASQTSYNYAANFAVGLCEGPIAMVRRVWADGQEIDPSTVTMRVYRGDESQTPDPLIVAKEGAINAPAYRGLAYIVFEQMPLANFGNRIPQLSFEVLRPIEGLGSLIRGVCLIPGATEFGYSPVAIRSAPTQGATAWENRHLLSAPSDWTASLDALQALCPNLTSVALVVSWFGDDLRASHCTVAPRVELAAKTTVGAEWSVDGLTRASARIVSQADGAPAYGGTPSDDSVLAAIADLRARGLSVVLYPFMMMDVPPSNTLPDPWTGAGAQPAYPWRGRITCDPAPGVAGSPDGTAAATDQVGAFFGSGSPSPSEFSYRRFVLHYARLCAAAGGVDAMLIGSELASLTRVRSASGVYPAANALAALANDVKAIVGSGVKVSYGADWTEYGAHVLSDGAEVRFPLDVLWSSPAVDFVGLDAYFPLSDWRDGDAHLDVAVARAVHDIDYLRARVASGEGYDWYYADDASRRAQGRLPITDGLAGKPWVFRPKDLVGWWSNRHFERVGNVELPTHTGWSPAGKPIWLMELGCPAIDRGANAPNVFPDSKSSASGLPPFSRGFRDDLMQARAIEAMISHFDPATTAANPPSPVYGGAMIDTSRMHVWAWDARPFPSFPAMSGVWNDAGNWETGHWLTGRLEGVAIDRLVETIINDARPGEAPIERPAIDGFLDGYALDKVMSPRDALTPLASMFGFDAIASGGRLRFSAIASLAVVELTADDLAPDDNGALVSLTRAQESETPNEIELSFTNGDLDYRASAVMSRRIEGGSRRQASTEAAIVTNASSAQHLLDTWLRDLWVSRETATFSTRPGLIAIEVGDIVALPVDGARRLFRVTRATDAKARSFEARAVEPDVFDAAPPRLARPVMLAPRLPGPPDVKVLDLAIARDTPTTLQYVAAFADPWSGPQALWRASGEASFELAQIIERRATIGVTLDDLRPGPVGRYDNANAFRVALAGGALAAVTDAQMLGGANRAAVRGVDGAWEIIGFARADLVAANVWRLSRLLRGLGGQEYLANRTLPSGADFVLLDGGVAPLVAGLAEWNTPRQRRLGPADMNYVDERFTGFSTSATALSLRPFAPVRATARRGPDGVAISFIRRGRVEADAWEPIDVPLGEDIERYEIDILDGDMVRRTLVASAPSLTYASADEIADFGAPVATLDLRIQQMSATAGRGFPLATTVVVD